MSEQGFWTFRKFRLSVNETVKIELVVKSLKKNTHENNLYITKSLVNWSFYYNNL